MVFIWMGWWSTSRVEEWWVSGLIHVNIYIYTYDIDLYRFDIVSWLWMGLSYLAFRSFLKLQTASSVDFQPFLKAGLYNIYIYIYTHNIFLYYIYLYIIFIFIYLYTNNCYYYLLLLLLLFLSLLLFSNYIQRIYIYRYLCVCMWISHHLYAQNRTFARSLCFLARNSPSFPRTPTKSAKGCCRKLLWNEPWSKFCVVRMRGATPSVPSIPARRFETWMKHVLKPVEKWDILRHHGRTLQ